MNIELTDHWRGQLLWSMRWLAAMLRIRAMAFILALAMGIGGYLLAPADLIMGDYTAQVQVTLAARQVVAMHDFALGKDDGEDVQTTVTNGPYRLTLAGATTVAYGLNKTINYRARLTDPAGQPIALQPDQITSIITGANYRQSLPPTSQDDGWFTFAMHVPFCAKIALGLLFVVATLWLTETIPLAAAAMLIPIVVVVTGISDASTVLQPFAHPIIVLFLAGFLMAEGMHRTGVDRLVALTILNWSSLRPAYLMLTMMGLTAFLSMWMSNTASVAIIIPIALAILNKLPDEAGAGSFRRALILGVAYAATVGGIGSAIGTPANILAITYLNEFTGTDLTFVGWFRIGLPMTIVMIPVIWLYLLISFRVKTGQVGNLSRAVFQRERAALGSLTPAQWIVLLTFGCVMLLWLTERWHGIPTAVVALMGAFLLFATTTIDKDDLNRINWNALLTFGGGLAIGTLLTQTGVSDWIALQLTGLAQQPPFLVIFLVAALTLVIGAFISNTACAAMLIPIAIPLAQVLQIDPRLLVAVIAIASSVDFALVVGTPPTMMAYSTGLFRVKEIVRRGLLLDLIGLLILSFGVIWIWRLLGVISLP